MIGHCLAGVPPVLKSDWFNVYKGIIQPHLFLHTLVFDALSQEPGLQLMALFVIPPNPTVELVNLRSVHGSHSQAEHRLLEQCG